MFIMKEKSIYAAIRRCAVDPKLDRPHKEYTLLQIGAANSPLEHDRQLRYRLYDQYGYVPECLVLDEITDSSPESWSEARARWKDFFKSTFEIDWDAYMANEGDNPIAAERDDIRSHRLLGEWQKLYETCRLIPASALPKPGVTASIEIAKGTDASILFARIAADNLEITSISSKPGKLPTVSITGAANVVSRFIDEMTPVLTP